MISISRFKFATVNPGAVFPNEACRLYAVNPGHPCVIVVTSVGVKIVHVDREQADYADKLPYLKRQLVNLHRRFADVSIPGLTYRQQREYDGGIVLLGQLEHRSLNSHCEFPPRRIAGPDEFAFTAFTAVPVGVYQRGEDTVGHSIRYQSLAMALPQPPVGVMPYIKPMKQLISTHMMHYNHTSYSGQLWLQAQDEVLSNGKRDILVFSYYSPWSQSAPLCQLIPVEVVRQHFGDDEL